MGKDFIDKFSALHLAAGIVAGYSNMSLELWCMLHFIFEVVENTFAEIVDKIPYWPGGKGDRDTLINSFGDQLSAILGWIIGNTYLQL